MLFACRRGGGEGFEKGGKKRTVKNKNKRGQIDGLGVYSRDNPSPPDLIQIAGMVIFIVLAITFVCIVGSPCNEFNYTMLIVIRGLFLPRFYNPSTIDVHIKTPGAQELLVVIAPLQNSLFGKVGSTGQPWPAIFPSFSVNTINTIQYPCHDKME